MERYGKEPVLAREPLNSRLAIWKEEDQLTLVTGEQRPPLSRPVNTSRRKNMMYDGRPVTALPGSDWRGALAVLRARLPNRATHVLDLRAHGQPRAFIYSSATEAPPTLYDVTNTFLIGLAGKQLVV